MFQRFTTALDKYLFFYYFIHMKMKKMLLGAFLGMFAVAGITVLPNQTHAYSPQVNTDEEWVDFSETYQWWDAQDTQYNAGVAGSSELQNDTLINTIRTAINWVLGILSLIALALCLWGGFQMMTSGGDQKKYEAGINLLKWAAIGLAIIALSWLIVSLIFFVINSSVWTEVRSEANGSATAAANGWGGNS